MWATTEVRPRGKDSVLAETKKAKEWIDSIPDLDEMYTCKTYEELEKIVNDWLNGDDAESSDDLGTSRGASPASSTDDTATTSTKKYKSLDDAFADLEDL